ncbi:Imm8 family immunity protein [Nocardia sp. NPDC050712]|uniref:Imm8 family immunity protein n=1 Tax=Nocardia sp. NPDC050712 TaxID=3155518 RepID=UPI0033F074B6
MKAELKGLHSPDADLTSDVLPDNALFVQLMIGPLGGRGEESFDVTVCTPAWRDQVISKDPDAGRFLLVLDRIEFESIEKFVTDFLAPLERPTWQELAAEIGKLGKWEFLDYRP